MTVATTGGAVTVDGLSNFFGGRDTLTGVNPAPLAAA
jgi:hypothetical protein